MMNMFMALFASLWFWAVYAQEPVHWNFSAKKIDGNTYEIHISATIDAPWHTYSQWTPADGPLPTKIIFTQNPLVALNGKTRELGELHRIHDKTFGVDVHFFEGGVDFVQALRLKGNTKTAITGTVEFMTCNERKCLPPKKIPFTILLQ
jgi:cytochrome c biogenesis DsbD-like protein